MARSTFAGVASRLGLKPGEEWKVAGSLSKSSAEAVVAEMDEIGIERAIMVAVRVWSWRPQQLMMDYNIDEIAEVTRKTKGRLLGPCSYNPLRIKEALRRWRRQLKSMTSSLSGPTPLALG